MMSIEVRNAVIEAAKKYKHNPIQLMAVIDVESAGRVFWNIGGEKLPVIRPEGHYFYRLLKEPQRQQAVKAGLAWPRYSPSLAPRTWSASWATFRKMAKINLDVAIMSCSWGLGQVMGSDYRKLGFTRAIDFRDANNSLEGQIDIMLRYIDADGLRGALAKGGKTADSWRPFARGYNGPAYARLGYHKKMMHAYGKYVSVYNTGFPDNKAAIKEIQQTFKTLGYYKGPINGIEDIALIDGIKAFQLNNALDADGRYGIETQRRAVQLLSRKESANAEKMVGVGGGGAAIGAAGEKIINQISPLQTIGGDIMQTIIALVIMAGVALVIYGLYRRWRLESENKEIVQEEEARADVAEEVETEWLDSTEDARGAEEMVETEGEENGQG